LALALASLHPLALPQCIVGILDRQRRQLGLLATTERAIAVDQLLDHQLHRGAVGNDVVLGQHQHMVVFAHLQQARAQQRPFAQVEEHGDLPRHRLFQLPGIGQYLHRQRQRERRANLLQQLPVDLDEHAAQYFVTLDQRREAALQRGHVQGAAQAQRRGDVIRRAVRFQVPEEPLTLLGIGQPKGLVGITPENRRDAIEVDPLLTQQNRQGFALLGRKRAYRFD